MGVALKEIDGRREVELSQKDGMIFIDGGEGMPCYAFDESILLRAFERLAGVRVIRDRRDLAMLPCGGGAPCHSATAPV